MLRVAVALTCVVGLVFSAAGQNPAPPAKSSREALQPLGDLVGSWRGTGSPFGSREEQQKGFWVETLSCGWKFKGTDAWLTLAFDKSKHLASGELRFLPDKNVYQITLKTLAGQELVYRGAFADKVLTLATDDESERFVVTLLHDNRFLYRKDVRPEGKKAYTKLWQVGATREGVPFAAGSGQPECIVTGGLGTSTVTFQGKTYYVCCTGCRDEFNADPAKYVKDFEAKKSKR
jgi:hypothetical protein